MAAHSSVLAWRIPGTGEPGGLPSMGLHRVGHDWSDLAAAAVAFFIVQLSHPYMTIGKSTGVGFIAFSKAWKWKVKVKSLSRVQLLVTPWTAAYQAPPSIGFSRQEYYLSHQESPLKNIHIKKKKLNWSVMIANETVKNDLCVRKQRTAGKIKSQVTWTPTIKDSVLALHFMNGWPPLAFHLFV